MDPQNLGGKFDIRGFDYARELVFYMTPDQKYALDEMSPVRGKRIVEIGAGISVNALYLARQGSTVIATDIAHERLCALRAIHAKLGTAPGQILFVKCAAEALPFRDNAFDHAYSKAVLIHTKLDQSTVEIHRTLKPGSCALLIEPMTGNPFANIYRATLAPKIWQRITRYFGQPELGMFRRQFPKFSVQYYYLFSFLAFAWQFGAAVPVLFRFSLTALLTVDRMLFCAFPSCRRNAWFCAIRVEK